MKCSKCQGSGRALYANSKGWRNKGVAQETIDICDRCWGSGDPENPWLDLRHMLQALNQTIPILNAAHAHMAALRRIQMAVQTNGSLTHAQWEKIMHQWEEDVDSAQCSF